MIATAISRIERINKNGVDRIKLEVESNEKFLNKLNRRCPATMLAESRMDSVIGRIIFLTSSIRTIKFIKAMGVPVGTMWAIILFELLIHPYNIILIQRIIAVGNESIIWADGVKMKGNKARKFINKILINKDSKTIIDSFLLVLVKRGFNSFSMGLKIELIILFHFLFFIFLIKMKAIGIITEIQEMAEIDIDGSNIENKLFIIIIYLI